MHRKTTTKAGMKERARLQTDRGSQNHGQQPGRQAPGMKERAWLQMDQAHRTMSHNREGRYQSGMRQPGSRPRGPPKPCPSTTKEVNRYKTDEHQCRHQTWKREPGSKEWRLPKPCPSITKAAIRYKRDLHEGRHQAWKREPGLEEREAQAMSPKHKVINRSSNDKSKGNRVIVNNCQSSKVSLHKWWLSCFLSVHWFTVFQSKSWLKSSQRINEHNSRKKFQPIKWSLSSRCAHLLDKAHPLDKSL